MTIYRFFAHILGKFGPVLVRHFSPLNRVLGIRLWLYRPSLRVQLT